MKRSKAFTLVELIAVITILGIIALITVPAVNRAVEKSNLRALEQQTKNIVDASKIYALDNIDKLSKYDQGETLIHVGDLVDDGYLAEIPVDPTTNIEMSDCVVVTYQESLDKYTYEYGECKVNIVINNTYIGGDRLMIFANSSVEETILVSELLEGPIGSLADMLQQYSSKEVTASEDLIGIIYDENDIAIDGFDLSKIKLTESYMYMDFYDFLVSLMELSFISSISEGTPLKMYVFGDPDTLSIYFGMGFVGSEYEVDALQELNYFSSKNIHTVSDYCQVIDELTIEEPFTCEYDTAAEIKID